MSGTGVGLANPVRHLHTCPKLDSSALSKTRARRSYWEFLARNATECTWVHFA